LWRDTSSEVPPEEGRRRYDGLAMADTLKCPSCGAETEPGARKCGKCQYYLKSELECLRSIDASVGIMKRITDLVAGCVVFWRCRLYRQQAKVSKLGVVEAAGSQRASQEEASKQSLA
jgi:hypothetical protein